MIRYDHDHKPRWLFFGDIDKLLPRLIERMGKDWKAPNQMGFAHVLLLAWKKPRRSIIQRLLRDPRGKDLLLAHDASGKSAMDILRTHEHWNSEHVYLAQLARKLLREGSQVRDEAGKTRPGARRAM